MSILPFLPWAVGLSSTFYGKTQHRPGQYDKTSYQIMILTVISMINNMHHDIDLVTSSEISTIEKLLKIL